MARNYEKGSGHWEAKNMPAAHGHRNIGRAGGEAKLLRAMETYKKQKNRHQLYLLLLNNIADLKNNKRNYRKFASIRSR